MSSDNRYEIREEVESLLGETGEKEYSPREFKERAEEIGISPEEMNTVEKLAYGETLVNIVERDYEEIEENAEDIIENFDTLAEYQQLNYEIATNNTEALRQAVSQLNKLAEHTHRIDEKTGDSNFDELYNTIENVENRITELKEEHRRTTSRKRTLRENHRDNMSNEDVSDILNI